MIKVNDLDGVMTEVNWERITGWLLEGSSGFIVGGSLREGHRMIIRN